MTRDNPSPTQALPGIMHPGRNRDIAVLGISNQSLIGSELCSKGINSCLELKSSQKPMTGVLSLRKKLDVVVGKKGVLKWMIVEKEDLLLSFLELYNLDIYFM